MERIGDMPVLLLFVFRFVRLLLSGHQAVAIENAALRMQIAADHGQLNFRSGEIVDSDQQRFNENGSALC